MVLCCCGPLLAHAQPQAPMALAQQVDRLERLLSQPDTLKEDLRSRSLARIKASPYWVAILRMDYVGGNGTTNYVGIFREEKTEHTGFGYTLMGVNIIPSWIQVGRLPAVVTRSGKSEVVEIEAYISITADDPKDHGKRTKLRYRLPGPDEWGITFAK